MKLSTEPRLLALHLLALHAALNAVVTADPRLSLEVVKLAGTAENSLLASTLTDDEIRFVREVLSDLVRPPHTPPSP
jgi:hypothetical protein